MSKVKIDFISYEDFFYEDRIFFVLRNGSNFEFLKKLHIMEWNHVFGTFTHVHMAL